jgi:hypothetical protein
MKIINIFNLYSKAEKKKYFELERNQMTYTQIFNVIYQPYFA